VGVEAEAGARVGAGVGEVKRDEFTQDS